MDKKTRLYLIVFTLLLLAVGVVYLFNKKRANHVNSDQSFAETDTLGIQRVVLTDTKGDKISIVREGKKWRVNDSIDAMPTKINFLMRTLASLKIVSIIDPQQAAKVTSIQLKKFVRVELFDHPKDKPYKVYYVGEPTQTNTGNYAMMEIDGQPTGKPYIIGITNITGDLQPRFFTGPNDWRDLKIFDAKIDDIKQVTMLYPYHPASSFKITVIGKDSGSIEKLYGPKDTLPEDDRILEEALSKKKGTVSKPRINDFLNSFSFINAEAFDNEYAGKDTILNKKPLAKIYLTLKSGEMDSITVFLMPANQRTKADFDPHGNPVKYDMDRYFALINHNKDFVVIQQYVFGKIFRQRNDFYIYQ